jgi:hypothetical protein
MHLMRYIFGSARIRLICTWLHVFLAVLDTYIIHSGWLGPGFEDFFIYIWNIPIRIPKFVSTFIGNF